GGAIEGDDPMNSVFCEGGCDADGLPAAAAPGACDCDGCVGWAPDPPAPAWPAAAITPMSCAAGMPKMVLPAAFCSLIRVSPAAPACAREASSSPVGSASRGSTNR